jgi:hypothetical protein
MEAEDKLVPASAAAAPAVGLSGLADEALADMARAHQGLVAKGNALMTLPVFAVLGFAFAVYRGVVPADALTLAVAAMVAPLLVVTGAFAWLRSRFMRSLVDRGLDHATAREALRQLEIAASKARFVSGRDRRAERVTAHLLEVAARSRAPDDRS